jgi:hypothetical protein
LKAKQWIVYAKAPFAGPQQILDYLGRYTHRVAIANHRLVPMDGRQMTLAADEFIRRFLLHVLPPRLVKIRYFSFLFHRDKRRNIALIRALMHAQVVMTEAVVEDAQQIMHKIPKGCPIRVP